MKRIAHLVLVLLALALLACGEIPTEPAAKVSSTDIPANKVAPTQEPVAPKQDWPAEAQPLVELAIADLVARTKATTATVVTVEAVEWRDGCLECAKEDERCMQVIVPGYRIVLQVDEQRYEYHTDTDQQIRPCPAVAEWGEEAQRLVDQALADLAERLQISQDEITVLSVEQVNWPDSSIGCPKPGQAYLTVIVPGYKIVLEAAGTKYDYHAGDEGEVFLCEQTTQ
jgi:hypothetical protein